MLPLGTFFNCLYKLLDIKSIAERGFILQKLIQLFHRRVLNSGIKFTREQVSVLQVRWKVVCPPRVTPNPKTQVLGIFEPETWTFFGSKLEFHYVVISHEFSALLHKNSYNGEEFS